MPKSELFSRPMAQGDPLTPTVCRSHGSQPKESTDLWTPSECDNTCCIGPVRGRTVQMRACRHHQPQHQQQQQKEQQQQWQNKTKTHRAPTANSSNNLIYHQFTLMWAAAYFFFIVVICITSFHKLLIEVKTKYRWWHHGQLLPSSWRSGQDRPTP